MKEKNKGFLEQNVKFLRVRDKVAAYVLKGLLALFNAIGPVWNFFFLKTEDGPQITEFS